MGDLIRDVHVQNFKSIPDLSLELGRVNVFIGENGCGKSNFLEALAFASAALSGKLDNEFLASRGIRVTEPQFMRSAFEGTQADPIEVTTTDASRRRFRAHISTMADSPFPEWRGAASVEPAAGDTVAPAPDEEVTELASSMKTWADFKEWNEEQLRNLADSFLSRHAFSARALLDHPLRAFLIYSPENTALRTFSREGQILPLGVKGEGLFRLLKVLSSDQERWTQLKQNLRMLQWFGDIEVPADPHSFEESIRIKDRFIAETLSSFDQRSANEGFLFLLFYFSLIISPDTPSLFAVDNIDASLNPKTATELTRRIAKLAVTYNKQVILTTHSPAVLDGLDLKDDEQRLFVFYRNKKGETRSRRLTPPTPLGKEPPVKLSEAFMRGLLGGLPQNF
jgi:predicted ATPase